MHRGLLFTVACLLSLPLSAQAEEYYYGLMLGNKTYEESGTKIGFGDASAKCRSAWWLKWWWQC